MRDATFNPWFGVRRAGAVLLLATFTMQACSSWATQEGPVTQVVEPEHPSTVRVTTSDGGVWQVMRPRIVDDSLHGVTPDNLAVSIAVSRIVKVDAWKISPGRTELLGLAVLIAWFGNRF